MSQGISQSDENSVRLSNVKGPINVRKISPAMASVATNSKNAASFEQYLSDGTGNLPNLNNSKAGATRLGSIKEKVSRVHKPQGSPVGTNIQSTEAGTSIVANKNQSQQQQMKMTGVKRINII